MALTRLDFKNLPSSGIIPDDRVPASSFAVGYTFTYYGSPSLSTFNHTFTGKVVLHVLDSFEGILYVITMEETYNLFIFPLAPGLVLYTWNWVPSAESIVGRKGESEDAPLMETLGAGSFGVEPAEGSGTTDFEVIINSRFYSGIFEELLTNGNKFKIKFHNLSAGFVVKQASLQLATVTSDIFFAAILDWTSNLRIASAEGNGGVLLQRREVCSGRKIGALRVRQFLTGLKNVKIAKTLDNAFWILANQAEHGRLFLSEDDCSRAPKRATFRTTTGEEKEIEMFGIGFKMLDLKAKPNGVLVALAERDNTLYICQSSDNWIHNRRVGPKQNNSLYQLGLPSDDTILVATAGHEYLLEGDGKPIERTTQSE